MNTPLQSGNDAEKTMMAAILDLIPFAIYVVDIKTYEIVFMNHYLRQNGDVSAEAPCYQKLYRQDGPCLSCQIPSLIDARGQPNGKTVVFERFDDVDDRWLQMHEGLVTFFDGRAVKYSVGVDIGDIKKMQNDLAEAHAELALKNRKLERDAIEDLRRERELRDAHEQLKTAQKQLVQAEKMASLGQLVAGIAHEINTPLGNALTVASLLAEQSEDLRSRHLQASLRRSDLDTYLSMVDEEAGLLQHNLKRAADLVNSFTQIASDHINDEPVLFSVKSYLDDLVCSLSQFSGDYGHQTDIECTSTLSIESYPTVWFQILSHLIINSVTHAYPNGHVGRLHIHARALDNRTIELHYGDNGIGISTDNQKKVFDPFFTTRRGSGSAGLGLPIVYNLVVSKLGGGIELTSDVGRGTSFIIRFPCTVVAP